MVNADATVIMNGHFSTSGLVTSDIFVVSTGFEKKKYHCDDS